MALPRWQIEGRPRVAQTLYQRHKDAHEGAPTSAQPNEPPPASNPYDHGGSVGLT